MKHPLKTAADDKKDTIPVQADITAAAYDHVKRVAAAEFRSPRKQLSKIIEEWHDANSERPSTHN